LKFECATIQVVGAYGCARIESSLPLSHTIDARQPNDPDGLGAAGFNELNVLFRFQEACDVSDLRPSDFNVEAVPAGAAPTIRSVLPLDPFTVRVAFDDPIPSDHWTKLCYEDPLGEVYCTCLGALPADSDGNGESLPADVLHLISCLGPGAACLQHQTDIDRSGLATPFDMLRIIDLLNGAEPFPSRLGATLPPSPCR